MRILLKGWVADGLHEPEKLSILIKNDLIEAVEKDIYGCCSAEKIFSFKDEIIAPGFIDVHGHSDLSLPAYPEAFSKRRQGVTAEITGNCGLSPFPVTHLNREHLETLYRQYGIEFSWADLSGYKKMLAEKKVRLRTFSLCGHNTLRAACAGYEKEHLSSAEIQQMQNMLTTALNAGSPGMSAGLLYTPGCFSDNAEIIELMKIIAGHDAVFTTHLRNEGDFLLESLTETLEAASRANLKKVQISHLKTSGKNNWHKLDRALNIIEKYRSSGIDVRFDRYPYVESQTMLSVILPPPYDKMSDRDITIALKDENLRNSLRIHLTEHRQHDWQRWRLTGTSAPYFQNFIGKKYSELPVDPANAVIEQLAFDATTATIGAAGMSEENMKKIILSSLCLPGSDGNALPPDDRFGSAHPRAFGAIAEFIRLKLENGNSIGETVKSATFSPANFFNLPGIGIISPGKKADITVFSPDEIGSDATFTNPYVPARGIRMTAVNGEPDLY